MKKSNFLFLAILFFTFPLQAQFTTENLEVQFADQAEKKTNEVGAITFGNLRIYPVLAKQTFEDINQDIGKYTPLEEALKSKKIVITEHVRSNTSRDTTNLEEPDSINNNINIM